MSSLQAGRRGLGVPWAAEELGNEAFVLLALRNLAPICGGVIWVGWKSIWDVGRTRGRRRIDWIRLDCNRSKLNDWE